MKILHVVPYKLDAYSGVYTSVAGMAGALARTGLDVEVWNLSPWPPEATELAAGLDAAGVTRRELPPSPRSWSLSAAARSMIDAELRADVVHLHSAFSPQNNLLARRVEGPTVLSPHGVLLSGSTGKSPIRKLVYQRLIELPALAKMAAVCALTDAEAAEVRAFGYRGRLEVIPNGVPEPPPGVDRLALRHRLGIDADARIGLYVGRIQIGHKRLDAVVQAFSASPGWHLVVVGADYRGDASRLQSRVAALPGADRIHLVGPKRGSDLAEAYAGADAFVLLSYSEGMSMALLEALSYGLSPVVSPEVEEALPVAESGAGWTATATNLPDRLNAIERLDEEAWVEKREAAGRLVSAYRWEAVANSYRALYESIG